jgi:hypothetical protein
MIERSRQRAADGHSVLVVAVLLTGASPAAVGQTSPGAGSPETGTCGPCAEVGLCPPTLPLKMGSDHRCEDWSGGDLAAAYVPFSDFSNADLSGANLELTLFNGAKLHGANLAGASMQGTRFYLADLEGARIDGGQISSAVFIGTRLNDVVGLDQAIGSAVYDICTDFSGTGFDPDEAGWLRFPQLSPLEVCETELTLSLSRGGKQRLHLEADIQHAGRFFWLLGSASGTTPGIPSIPPVPLNVDAYMEFTVSHPETFIKGGVGYLDSSARAQAAITIAPNDLDPTFAGIVLNHAFLILDEKLGYADCSNPVPLTFVP